MALSDPIADMLTRIRNAVRNHEPQVTVCNSKVCTGIAQVLKDEGYINGYDVIDDGKQGILRVELKYGGEGQRVITAIQRISKPSCRVYKGVDDLPRILGGMGIVIISTSQGILSDRQAREKHIGGELLASVQ